MSSLDLHLRPDPQTRISEIETIPPAAARLIALWRQWRARVEARRVLAGVDDRTLRDAGIVPAHADFELSKPFWHPLSRHGRG